MEEKELKARIREITEERRELLREQRSCRMELWDLREEKQK